MSQCRLPAGCTLCTPRRIACGDLEDLDGLCTDGCCPCHSGRIQLLPLRFGDGGCAIVATSGSGEVTIWFVNDKIEGSVLLFRGQLISAGIREILYPTRSPPYISPAPQEALILIKDDQRRAPSMFCGSSIPPSYISFRQLSE